ncbi:hypothetical protein ACFV0R_21390 [Streptomyces sp. NPDC059578]|uniref:hypothetical protein n=1 Tax=Streptomyces sp. NPDC059578 TaxID=3346874 RepID=UPI00367EC2E1
MAAALATAPGAHASPRAPGTTYYVDALSGNDANSGTPTAPLTVTAYGDRSAALPVVGGHPSRERRAPPGRSCAEGREPR